MRRTMSLIWPLGREVYGRLNGFGNSPSRWGVTAGRRPGLAVAGRLKAFHKLEWALGESGSLSWTVTQEG